MYLDSEEYITFITSLRAYKYRVLPFELTNKSFIYQQYMNDILFEYINDFYQTYLDNILIYSKTRKNYIKHVRLMLQRLRESDLQINILKCEFHIQEIKFLDLIVFIESLRINSSKVQIVLNWSISINLKQT